MRKMALAGASILVAAACFAAVFLIFFPKKIVQNVYINGLHAGGMTASQFLKIFDAHTVRLAESGSLKLALRDATDVNIEITYASLKIHYDAGAALKEALRVKRRAAAIARVDIVCEADYDREVLAAAIEEFAQAGASPATEPEAVPDSARGIVLIKPGRNGASVDRADTLARAAAAVRGGFTGTLVCERMPVPPALSSAGDLMTLLDRSPADATYRILGARTLVVHEASPGWRPKDAAAALALLERAVTSNWDAPVDVPVEFLQPEMTGDRLRACIFRDTLAEFATEYYAGSDENSLNRTHNIRLAMDKLDGQLIAPGEVFSFNDRVGERSEKAGYKIATIYMAGELGADYGGGICQVSTTLFNAALLAGMDVTERVNHTFKVGYVMPGFDATVSYGWLDLSFRNTLPWPVRIRADASAAGKALFRLEGTLDGAAPAFQRSFEVLETVPFAVVYKEDPSLPPGSEKIVQEGQDGCLVETYLTVQESDGRVSKKRLYKSRYRPLDRIILRGPGAGPAPLG